jgi:arylsulfatase
LSPKEVTVAEVLSDAGYHTAMWGKWHLGDEPEHCPTNQGYDYGFYGLYNGAPDAWQDSFELYDTPNPMKAPFMDFPGYEEYERITGIDLSVAGYVAEKGKGRKPIPGPAGKLGIHRQEAFENETNQQMRAWIAERSRRGPQERPGLDDGASQQAREQRARDAEGTEDRREHAGGLDQ